MAVETAKSERTHRLTNFMEEMTGDILQELIHDYKGTSFTSQTMNDIKALALNRLWPMYTTSTSGREFLRKMALEDKVEQDIIRELRVAIDIVRANPHR